MISVVILNFNGKRYLENCLLLFVHSDIQELRSDTSRQWFLRWKRRVSRSAYPSVLLIKNKKNLGFAGGTNAGIRQAKGEFILTLNNDTYVDNRFLERLVMPMILDNGIGMCAPKMLLYDDRINSTGICISRSGAAWDRGMFEMDEGQYDTPEEVFGPCAGAALYRKKMFDEIGLFDEDFFLYVEDVDLAFRGRLAGWKCLYVPDAKVHHIYGGTLAPGSDLSVYYGNRNITWYLVKNLPINLLIESLPWVIGRYLEVVAYYALMSKGRIILKSKFDSLKGLPKMAKKRGQVMKMVSDDEIRKYLHTWAKIPRR